MIEMVLASARRQLGGLQLELLTALAPIGRSLPSFLMPAPIGPWGVLAEELAAVAATPSAVVRAELDIVRDGKPLPAVLRPLYEDSTGQLPAVVAAMRRYWEVTVEPVGPRLCTVCMADLSRRMQQYADGGLTRGTG